MIDGKTAKTHNMQRLRIGGNLCHLKVIWQEIPVLKSEIIVPSQICEIFNMKKDVIVENFQSSSSEEERDDEKYSYKNGFKLSEF